MNAKNTDRRTGPDQQPSDERSRLIWMPVCQVGAPESAPDVGVSGLVLGPIPARCACRRPEPGSRLGRRPTPAGGLALTPVRTTSSLRVRGIGRAWRGSGWTKVSVSFDDEVKADMRGLVTAGPCVRLGAKRLV